MTARSNLTKSTRQTGGPSPEEITGLLLDWGNGDKAALDRVIPLVYQELRRLAHRQMRRERAGDTLQTTALINEAYLRLVDYARVRPRDRAHFFAIAAQAMRRILIERARSRRSAKRGSGAPESHWRRLRMCLMRVPRTWWHWTTR